MNKKMMLASAAALIFASQAGAVQAGAADSSAAGGDKIKCAGTHSCKGNSDCKGNGSPGAGKNACGPYGFKYLTEKQCDAKGGKEV